MKKQRAGAEQIADERARQLAKLGWSARHDDDEHVDGELAWAAVCYAAPLPVFVANRAGDTYRDPWPWNHGEDARPRERDGVGHARPMPEQRLRLLVKAGALIAAEIDRLQRKATP